MEELIDLIEQIQHDLCTYKEKFVLDTEVPKRELIDLMDFKCYAAKQMARSLKDHHETCTTLIKRMGWQ